MDILTLYLSLFFVSAACDSLAIFVFVYVECAASWRVHSQLVTLSVSLASHWRVCPLSSPDRECRGRVALCLVSL